MSANHKRDGTAYKLKKARPHIDAILPAPCVNQPCKLGGIVHPGQTYDVGHIIDKAAGGADVLSNFGPAHPGCNRRDGGKIGARITNARRKAGTTSGRRAW